MINWEVVVGVIGAIIALAALLVHINIYEAFALLFAFVTVIITLILAQPLTLSTGTQCPGSFGGTIAWGYAAQHSFDQLNKDRQECDMRTRDMVITWFAGGSLFIGGMIGAEKNAIFGRSRRTEIAAGPATSKLLLFGQFPLPT